MTTNLDIIKKAMKKLHVLARGTNPSSSQASDCMDALQSLIVEMIGQGSFGKLRDVLATSAYTAKENERIQASHGVVVTLPTVITTDNCGDGGWSSNWAAWYGAPYNTLPRPPRDRSVVVVITDNVPVYNVWCTYLNQWVVVNSLTQQGAFPFAQYLEDGFAALLAERIADDFASQAGPSVLQAARSCRWMIAAKPDSVRPTARTEYM